MLDCGLLLEQGKDNLGGAVDVFGISRGICDGAAVGDLFSGFFFSGVEGGSGGRGRFFGGEVQGFGEQTRFVPSRRVGRRVDVRSGRFTGFRGQYTREDVEESVMNLDLLTRLQEIHEKIVRGAVFLPSREEHDE